MTVGSLIGKKTTSEALKNKLPSERFSKRRLAESAARRVREHQMPIPDFCSQIFVKIAGLLQGMNQPSLFHFITKKTPRFGIWTLRSTKSRSTNDEDSMRQVKLTCFAGL